MKNKTSYLSVFGIVFFFISSVAMANTLNCKKSLTNVEKIICSNNFIFELDKKLAKTYAEEMKQATKKEKALLSKYQKHWLKFTRNLCEDAKCVMRAYWSRLAEVSGFTFIMREKKSDRDLKHILSTSKFYSTAHNNTTTAMCQEILENLQHAKTIDFVKPKLTAMSYEDKVLDSWKQHCKAGQPLIIYPDPIMCPGHFKITGKVDNCPWISIGHPPFKVFEIFNVFHKQQYLFYMNGSHGALEIKNSENTFSGNSTYFFDVDIAQCKITPRLWPTGEYDWYFYEKLLKLNDKYYFLGVNVTKLYDLTITPVDNVTIKCNWSAKNPNP
jgi:uncharacterized protein